MYFHHFRSVTVYGVQFAQSENMEMQHFDQKRRAKAYSSPLALDNGRSLSVALLKTSLIADVGFKRSKSKSWILKGRSLRVVPCLIINSGSLIRILDQFIMLFLANLSLIFFRSLGLRGTKNWKGSLGPRNYLPFEDYIWA